MRLGRRRGGPAGPEAVEQLGRDAVEVLLVPDQPSPSPWLRDHRIRVGFMLRRSVPGHVSHNAVAATLADGRVLVAGGEQATCGANGCGGDTYVAVESASLYDPANDTWLLLPPMPEPRAGGTPVVLSDGSVLIVGGYTENTPLSQLCGWGPRDQGIAGGDAHAWPDPPPGEGSGGKRVRIQATSARISCLGMSLDQGVVAGEEGFEPSIP